MATTQHDLTREYSAFISYRHSDNKEAGRQWATWLHQTLEGYEIPQDLVGTKNLRGEPIPGGLYPVFRDEEELPADADLSVPINYAIRQSRHLIVICSPAAVASRFVNDEILAFKRLGKSDRVLAVMIRGEPNVADDPSKHVDGLTAADECFPLALRRKVDDEGALTEQPAEPIAADFRIDGLSEGWTTPQGYREFLEHDGRLTRNQVNQRVQEYADRCAVMRLKIIAGVLGVPLGELTRRDHLHQLRRARRRQRIIAGIATVLAIFLGLAIAGGIAGWLGMKRANQQTLVAESSLKQQRRMAFEAVVSVAETDDEHGRSEKIVRELQPYLADPELATHASHATAQRLVTKAEQGFARFQSFAERLRADESPVSLSLDDDVTLEMIRVPEGRFQMGSAKNTPFGDDVEQQHEVLITRPFYVSTFHVTQEQYQAVLGVNPSLNQSSPRNPVENVSWFDAVAFAAKLSAQAGPADLAFDLPTEAQWEYACLGGAPAESLYHFGGTPREAMVRLGGITRKLDDYAWFRNQPREILDQAFDVEMDKEFFTHPTDETQKKKKPNQLGLYDMHGNVFAWCRDWYDRNYYARSPKADPPGPERDELAGAKSPGRTIRGGSFRSDPVECRAASRKALAPTMHASNVGIRLIVSLRTESPEPDTSSSQ